MKMPRRNLTVSSILLKLHLKSIVLDMKQRMSGNRMLICIRKLFCFVFVFLHSFIFSQNKTSAVIEYKIINNTDLPSTMQPVLFVDGTTTIYLLSFKTKKYLNEQDAGPEYEFPDWNYTKIDHKLHDVLFFSGFGGNRYLIKDKVAFNWKISEESKTIGGYQCLKATTTFRGRNWEAWFAPELGMSYGPWKFHGLPGLIMEVYDDTQTFTWRVEKIEYKESDIFSRDFNTLVKTKNAEPISYRQFLEDQQEFHENATAERNRKNNTSKTAPEIRRFGYEIAYEWE